VNHRVSRQETQRRLSLEGPAVWRCLEELAGSKEFQAFVDDEFPDRAPDWNSAGSRRRFLTLMGASLALAGAVGCTRQPPEKIVPYVHQPEQLAPGKPLFYATAISVRGIGTGVLAESHQGRPTKIEGNQRHPGSLGATDAAMQASVLTLYDPDRSQTVLENGRISGWGPFLAALAEVREAAGQRKGSGLRLLTGTVTSPTLAAQIRNLLAAFPGARWHQYEPCGRHADRAGSLAAFGAPFNTVYRFDRARTIVSLDADFLDSNLPGHLRYTRDYTRRRRDAASGAAAPPRLYVAESSPSLAGGMADHRFRMPARDVEAFAAGLAGALGLPVEGAAVASEAVSAIARDLEASRGAGLVLPGEFQTPRVHAIAHALNQALGNTGETVVYTDRVEANPVDEIASISELVRDMQDGAVQALLILGGNPAYDAPADLDLPGALERVPFRAHLGLYADETAAHCHWHVPEAHYLEAWGDTRAYDGTVSIVQPLIAPIYDGKTAHEVLNVLLGRADRTAHLTVQDYWRRQHPGSDFDDFWQVSLHDGVIDGTALSSRAPPQAVVPPPASAEKGLEVVLRPDPAIGDGSLANNAWLQELPKPQSRMTWDNAVWISPRTAGEHGLTSGDRVELSFGGRSVQAPVWVQPGQADGSLTVHFGYGRQRAGRVGNGAGFNAYPLRTTGRLWHAGEARIARVAGRHEFAVTQHTQTMEERDPFRVATLAMYRAEPEFARSEDRRVPGDRTLFPLWPYPDHKWGMAIDLTACIGCQACAVACQAENNIPVVGKAEVRRGRHMNWIRVDRYFAGPPDDPEIYFQPVPCMHCETAPCEVVCPVAATVHSAEGLNQMVYNRCVGTRYCSNNCPYKVRRFNFLLYSDWYTESLKGVRNPDVTVRSRGVMEKCTYCVQRIERARIEAKKQDRQLRDGDILTACQQACPAQAIVFGDLNDPASEVSRRKREPRDYPLLEELNTRPRTTYQARLRHPNPELEDA
jgi:MoCo/4Fe-4S cofactor protein with predicted Tat translocation signal